MKYLTKRKLTKTQKLLMDCYEQLRKETDDIPSVQEVQERYLEKYGNLK